MSAPFTVGQRVKKRNGDTFSNNELVLTVSRVEYTPSGNWRVWFKETNTNLLAHRLDSANVIEAEEL